MEALAVRSAGGTVLFIANLTAEKTAVELPAAAGARAVVIDADGFERLTTTPDYLDKAARDFAGAPLTLDAYAVARIEYPAP